MIMLVSTVNDFVFDRVTITFNVNNSIPPQLEEDAEHTQKSQEDEVH